MSDIKIYFDGGCKPNPGKMDACVVVDINGKHEIFAEYKIGDGTNNIAEWTALVWAATIAKERGYTLIEFIGDSSIVVNQAADTWKIKEKNFLPFKAEFDALNQDIGAYISYIPRKKNKAGIYLEHGSLD